MIFQKSELPLEVVILLIGGLALLISGIILFHARFCAMPFYENGLHGLLLIIFALQMLTLGKTPLGEMRRTGSLSAAGMMIALIGMVTCFIPAADVLPRILLVLCFGLGGLIQFFRLVLNENNLKRWRGYGGVFMHLGAACVAVHVLSISTGIMLASPIFAHAKIIAADIILLGMAVVCLALALRRVYRQYPEAEKCATGQGGLSFEHSMIMLMGVFLLALGALLIPVNLGLLPFAPHAQLGLLMVIFAIQMLAAGNTPIGVFPRTWATAFVGFAFAVAGIVSCLVPEILVGPLTFAVGVLNILGGMIGLRTMWLRRQQDFAKGEPKPVPSILAKLAATQVCLNLLAIMFGSSMLFPNLVPGLLIGVILFANGCVLLYLLRVLLALGKKLEETGEQHNAATGRNRP